MAISETSVKRPVSTMMVFLAIILLGGISWVRLPQELFPSMNFPQLTVVTHYGNAAPEEIESLVTKVLEESVGTVPGAKRIRSISKEGTSLVFVEFQWGANMDFASLAVREKIDMVKDRLPNEATEPFVVKFNPFELPILILSVTGERSPADMLAFTKKFVKDELAKVDGVAAVSVSGGLERQILVELDQARMQAAQVALLKVSETLKRSNLNYPAGNIEEQFYEYMIRTVGEFETVEQIRDMVIGVREIEDEEQVRQRQVMQQQGKLVAPVVVESRFIQLGDVGDVKDTVRERTSISRYNGQPNLSLSVQKQTSANVIKTVENVKRRMKDIQAEMPGDITVGVIYDQSQFIRSSIDDVRDAGIQGAVMVFFILWIFLKDLKASLISTTALPIAIAFALMLMYFKGMSVNMMSLLGISLGVGDVVDSGIVVTEHRALLRSQGVPAVDATIRGASEMAAPIMSSRLTSIAVFLPTLFITGVSGILFKELGLTITFSLIGSVAVALTLVPCLLSRGEREAAEGASSASGASHAAAGGAQVPVPHRKDWLERMEEWYGRSLEVAMRYRLLVVAAVLGLFVLSVMGLGLVQKEFMPKIDEGQFIVKVTMPTGTKLEVTDQVLQQVEEQLTRLVDVETVSASAGSEPGEGGDVLESMGGHQGRLIVKLKATRARASAAAIAELKGYVDRLGIIGAKIDYMMQESVLATGSGGGAPITVEVKGNDQRLLQETADRIQQEMLSVPGLYGIKQDVPLPQPEVKVNVRKDRATLFHLSVQDVALTAHGALKGLLATKFKEGGKEVDVMLRLKEHDRANLANLRSLLVASPLEVPVMLSDVAYITRGLGPSQISRSDQQRVIPVTANVAAGYSVSVAMDQVSAKIQRMTDALYKRYPSRPVAVALSGEREQMEESFKSLRFALILAIMLIYMIMASQFESLWQPFIVMFTMPLGLIGVVLTLLLTHTPLSVVVLLGAIMLAGNVVNNGIILVDSINQETQAGRSLEETVLVAARTRLRPILMTTLTTIFGYLPLVVAKTLMSPLALVSIGGMAVSTMLTLWFIPAFYLIASSMMRVRVPVPASAPAFELPMGPQLAMAGGGAAVAMSEAPTMRQGVLVLPPVDAEESEEDEAEPLAAPQEESWASKTAPQAPAPPALPEAISMPPVMEEWPSDVVESPPPSALEAPPVSPEPTRPSDAQPSSEELPEWRVQTPESSSMPSEPPATGLPPAAQDVPVVPFAEQPPSSTEVPSVAQEPTAPAIEEPATPLSLGEPLLSWPFDASVDDAAPADTSAQPEQSPDIPGDVSMPQPEPDVEELISPTVEEAGPSLDAGASVPPLAETAPPATPVISEDSEIRKETRPAPSTPPHDLPASPPSISEALMLPADSPPSLLPGPAEPPLLPEPPIVLGERAPSLPMPEPPPMAESPSAAAPDQSTPTPPAARAEVRAPQPEEEMPLNRRQERLLEHLKQVRRITRKEYSDVFGISVPTAARDLKDLLDRGLVRARGPLGPGRWYELNC